MHAARACDAIKSLPTGRDGVLSATSQPTASRDEPEVQVADGCSGCAAEVERARQRTLGDDYPERSRGGPQGHYVAGRRQISQAGGVDAGE